MSTAKELKKEIERGVWDASLGRLYGRRAGVLERQRARYADALDCFAALYGGEREAAIYSAPGRTEIGGNHTDHNHGVVMAGAVDLDVIAVVSKNTDDVVRVKSKGFDGRDEVKLEQLSPVLAEQGRSAALIRGVAAGIAKQGGVLGGFDAYTTSDVLRGSGLSSSAAFEVVIGTVFNGEYNQGRFSAVDIAKISQYAENEYFGKPSGLMDQMACSVGSAITIDFKDTAGPIVDKVAFDLAKHGYALCITDTKGSHADLTPDYAAVRGEMEAVAAFLIGFLSYVWVLFAGKHNLSKIIVNIVGGVIMTVLALAFMHIPFLPILKLDGMMVGAIMPMIPGVAFVNAIRDIADTDFLSGLVRMIDALLVFVYIAIGVGVTLSIYNTMMGGILR